MLVRIIILVYIGEMTHEFLFFETGLEICIQVQPCP